MKKRNLIMFVARLVICVTVACVMLAFRDKPSIDMAALNEIRISAESGAIDAKGHEIVVIDFNGEVIFSTSECESRSYDEWLSYAIKGDWAVVEFSGGRILVQRPKDNLEQLVMVIIISLAILICTDVCIFYILTNETVFKPFNRLKSFAADIAAGNLDSPLLMDKKNAFGAFTESFDIMREELKRAKDKEIALEKSKKELVASLSHDIKTPIASIKAVSEVLALTETEEKKLKSIETIRRKATEIDELITDMFNVTLQDLSELKIKQEIFSSKEIQSMITEADHLLKLAAFSVPECLVSADRLRLKQVIGNVVNNSYKYANTDITVSAEIIDQHLSIEFKDYGDGVAEEELPLLTGKFYRGKNSASLGGAGLGLYISATILEKMGGTIECYNTENGFAVRISLCIA